MTTTTSSTITIAASIPGILPPLEGREPIGRDTASKLESVTPCLVNRLNTRANSTIA